MNYEEFFKTIKQKPEDRGAHYIIAIPKERDEKLESQWKRMISDQRVLVEKTQKNTERIKTQSEKLEQAVQKKLKINERKLEIVNQIKKAQEQLSMLPENPQAIEQKIVEAKQVNLQAYVAKMKLREQLLEKEVEEAYQEQVRLEEQIEELAIKAEALNAEAKESLVLQMQLEKRGHEFADKDHDRATAWSEKIRKTLQYKASALIYETEKNWVFRLEEPVQLKTNPMKE